MSFRGVEQEILGMPYTYSNGRHCSTIPVKVFHHVDAFKSGEKPTLVLPGLGEEGLVAAKFARQQQALGRGAVIGVLLFPSAETIDYVCKAAPEFLARHLNHAFGDDADATVNTISHSQSAGIEVLAAHNTPQLKGGRHALIAGVGSNSPVFHENQFAFWTRYMGNLRNPGQVSPRNWRIATDLTWRLFSDTIGSEIRNQEFLLKHKVNYALGMEQHEQYVQNLGWMVRESATAIFTGLHDPIFPQAEAEQYVGGTGVTFRTVVGAHEPIIGKLGRQQIDAAFDWMKQAA